MLISLAPELRPTTFSEPIIQGLLQEELGFQGVVMTNAIGMRDAVEVTGSRGETAVRALKARADVILCAG